MSPRLVFMTLGTGKKQSETLYSSCLLKVAGMTANDTPRVRHYHSLLSEQAVESGVQISFLGLSDDGSSGCGGGGGSRMTSIGFPVLA